jgi:hypothetical protein
LRRLGRAQEDAGERRPRPVRPDQEVDRHREPGGDHALGRDLQLVDGQGVAAGGPHAHRLPVAQDPDAPLRPRDQEPDRLPAAVGLDRRRQEQVGGPWPAGEEGLGPRQAVTAARQRGRGGGLVPPVPARLGLGEPAGQDRPLGGDLLEERLHPVPEPLGQEADPVQVHVDRQGGRRVPLGQPALGGDQVEGGRPHAAEVGRDGDSRVAGRHQLVEVLVAERVGLVVAGRPGGPAGDQAGGQVDDLLAGLGGARWTLHGDSWTRTLGRAYPISLPRTGRKHERCPPGCRRCPGQPGYLRRPGQARTPMPGGAPTGQAGV